MKVINLFGGPGTGKSTTAALVFGRLKQMGANVELVTEFAKDLVWEDRRTIECQPYIFGKQLWRTQRLEGKVDAVVTDSPLLLSAVYGSVLGEHWIEFVREQMAQFDNTNIFLVRDNEAHPFSTNGRTQATVAVAQHLDVQVLDMLQRFDEVTFSQFPVGQDGLVDRIIRYASV